MTRRMIAALIASGTVLVTISSSASAQVNPPPATGVPGEPNCHGQRVSFGSSQFGITPKDRAEFNEFSVKEYQERVRASCEAPEENEKQDRR